MHVTVLSSQQGASDIADPKVMAVNKLVCVRGIIWSRSLIRCMHVTVLSSQQGASDIADPIVMAVNNLVCVRGIIVCRAFVHWKATIKDAVEVSFDPMFSLLVCSGSEFWPMLSFMTCRRCGL